MSKVIHKFPLPKMDVTIQLDEDAEILHVGEDPATGYPAIWARVDPTNAKRARRFITYGTGHELSALHDYIGTAICGSMVWHVHEGTV